MITSHTKYPLSYITTMRLAGHAKNYIEFQDADDLRKIFDKYENVYFLGAGSNVIFSEDCELSLVRNRKHEIKIVDETEDHVYIKASAGLSWERLVDFTVSRNLWGIENLAGIPGTVGASPVQNIGAYGKQVSDTFHSASVYDKKTGQEKKVSFEEAKFDYRKSNFQSSDDYILSVTYRLSRKGVPNSAYPGLKEKIKDEDTPSLVANTIRKIRSEKLPSLYIYPNTGSFFKNPFVPKEKFYALKEIHPNILGFETKNEIKIPAGWLIEEAGLKGSSFGPVGVSLYHALVLINHGGARGEDVINAAKIVIDKIYDKFGIKLEPEVQLAGLWL